MSRAVVVGAGAYPEREDPHEGAVERVLSRARGPIIRRLAARPSRRAAFLRRVAGHGAALAAMNAAALREAVEELRTALRRHGFAEDVVARAFAIVRETASRTIGLRHFDVQLIGGRVLLDGMVAEMDTGEGKTLVATLPVATAALAGLPVHVITFNDYLAHRDAELMRPV